MLGRTKTETNDTPPRSKGATCSSLMPQAAAAKVVADTDNKAVANKVATVVASKAAHLKVAANSKADTAVASRAAASKVEPPKVAVTISNQIICLLDLLTTSLKTTSHFS